MAGSHHKLRRIGGCALCAAFVCAHLSAGTRTTPAHTLNPWDTATKARDVFEAEPSGTHTRAEYTRVMDNFRAIYHTNPGSSHAARAVEEVAELLAEQAHELHDAKSLADAEGQYAFLAKAYPAYAKSANAHIAALTHAAPEAAPPPTPQPAPHIETVDVPASAHNTAPAQVTGIRHWSTNSYTRVAIDLGDAVTYQAARVEHPDRIFFDLHHAKLAPSLAGKSFNVTDDGFLTRIRAAQYSDDVTRIVLDVHEVGEYSAFLLPNPYRLIIDIHDKAANSKQNGNDQVAVNSGSATPAWNASATPVERYAAQWQPASGNKDTGPSTLPPMPVTDGSASFGLPARHTVSTASAAPRVVISSNPTAAKPVPNSVTSAASASDVAAVSNQPGKVEATTHPTSAPIVSRAADAPAAPSTSTKTGRHSKPAPADTGSTAPAPGNTKPIPPIESEPAVTPSLTAGGETSLTRALGLKVRRIVIDAGHGGHDSGTLGVDGIKEKDVVLDVALRLGKLLHERLGAEVVYTRADDTFIPLETRTAIANKAQADLFISVHANSSPDASARGVEVYYLNFTSDSGDMRVAARENAVSTQSVSELSDLVKKIALKDKINESKELAADVDTALYAGLTKGDKNDVLSKDYQRIKDRGIKKAPFVVLIGANMPSILTEIGFVTNPNDAAALKTPQYRESVAESLYNGVARYASGINGQKTKTPSVERAAVSGK